MWSCLEGCAAVKGSSFTSEQIGMQDCQSPEGFDACRFLVRLIPVSFSDFRNVSPKLGTSPLVYNEHRASAEQKRLESGQYVGFR